jgi:hypothetical protein
LFVAPVLLDSAFDACAIAVVVQFGATFGVWILAERLHLSGILTVVTFAMSTARRAANTPARIRIPSFAVWDFAVFVLNVLAFILVGFQLKGIIGRIDATTLVHYTGVALAVCGATSELLRRRYEVMLRRAEAGRDGDERCFGVDAEIVRRATSAERERLIALRADGTIGAAAFQQIEQELDLEGLDLQQLAPDEASAKA